MSWSKIKHVLLIVLIALSLFLSFQLWTAGGELREPTSGEVELYRLPLSTGQ